MTAESTLASFVLAFALAGCGPTPLAGAEASSTAEDGSTSSTGPAITSTAATTATSDSGSTTTGDALDETGPLPPPGFLNQLDVPSYECDLYAENCPPGQKCVPIANDGGNSWNALACRPVVDDPDGPGDPCTITMGSPLDGYDSCEEHAMCWDVAPGESEGTCIALCIGSEQTPSCLDSGSICSIGAEPALALCLPVCDPLLRDCPEEDACYVSDYGYTCAPPAVSEGEGLLGDACEFANACSAGLFCGRSTDFCEGNPGCCLPYCDLTQPSCPGSLTCTPTFEPQYTPPGLEHVGVCVDQR